MKLFKIVELSGKSHGSFDSKEEAKSFRDQFNSDAGWSHGLMPFQIRRGQDHWKGESK